MTNRLVLLGLSVVLCLSATIKAHAATRVNVIFESGTSSAEQDRALLAAGASKVKCHARFNAVTALVPNEASWQHLASNASVTLVEESYVVHAITTASAKGKPGSGSGDGTSPPQVVPTGVDRIEAEPGQSTKTGLGVRVAIVDSGIDLDHPDLAPNIIAGFDAIRGGNGDDDNGHGSHVAGTVAAVNNSIGVVGVAPQASLIAVKVLARNGSGWSEDIAEGIDWAVNSGQADVINMSLGSSSPSSLIQTAVERAAAAGVVIVCAAGNEGPGDNTVGWPAAFPECIAVSAWTDLDGTSTDIDGSGTDESLASFSSRGAEVEVTAPGVKIYSTYKDGSYATLSGTSMASPHAAGVVALLIQGGSSDPRADLASNVEQVQGTAHEVGSGLIRVGTPPPPNDAPVVTLSSPQDGAQFDVGATIDFSGSAADTEDGNLTGGITWSSSPAGVTGSGGSVSVTLGEGVYTVTATVTDSGGKTGTASVTITVGSPPPTATSVSVASIVYGTEGGKGGSRNLSITVSLHDNLGNPVSGASVSIAVTRDGAADGSGTGTTGTTGSVKFIRSNAPPGTYSTTVTNVVAGSLTWNGVTPANSFTK